MLSKLNYEDFDRFYEIMEESFPIDERRPYHNQRQLLSNTLYEIYVLYKNDEIMAFITVYDLDKFIFVEHFAVCNKYRNQGLGGIILNELMKKNKMICLEVEPPLTVLAKRRIEFYKRNGFYYNDYEYIQPALADNQNAISLKLMTTVKLESNYEFVQTRDLIYNKVYKFI